MLTRAAYAVALGAAPGGGPGPVGTLGRRVARSVLPRAHARVVGESKVEGADIMNKSFLLSDIFSELT